jgi:hypothetical protein
MKKFRLFFTLSLLCMILVCCASSGVQAQGKNRLGVGVIIGDKTGFSMKKWIDDHSAADFAIGWSLTDPQFLFIHSDYLYHFNLVNLNKGRLPFYLGIGATITFASDFELGIRIPLGAEYIFEGTPIGIFGELAPRMNFLPETKLKMGGGGGIRFYF